MRYLFIIIWACWFLSEILLNRLIRSKKPDSKTMDKGSLGLIWLSIMVSITLGVLCAIYIRATIADSLILPYLGIALILTGMLIRFTAVLTLGKFFTVDLAIHPDQHIVQTGLYRYVRHPSYTGSLLSFTGFALSLNNWASLAVIIIPVLVTFINRILIEEKLLVQTFGNEYEEYRKKTKRLIPYIY